MRSYDVYMDTFVNVVVADDFDEKNQAQVDAMLQEALEKFRSRLDCVEFTFEEYEE